MSDVKCLLDSATPLPWRVFDAPRPGIDAVNPISTVLVYGTEDEDYGLNKGDAALIVYAVNHLPSYEAVADALETALLYVEYGAKFNMAFAGRPAREVAQEGRAALRRLRGES